jgi:hypothetical protein
LRMQFGQLNFSAPAQLVKSHTFDDFRCFRRTSCGLAELSEKDQAAPRVGS